MDASYLEEYEIHRGDSNPTSSIARLLGSRKHKRNLLVKAQTNLARGQLGTHQELRRHVRAVTMGDERPLPVVLEPTHGECNPQQDRIHRHSADLGRPRPRKLRSKRRAASTSALPLIADDNDEKRTSHTLFGRNAEVIMAPTITIQPLRISRFEVGPPGLEAIDEDEPSTPRSPTISYNPFPPYANGMGSPASPTKRCFDSPPPTKLNSPRKLSNSSTNSTLYSRESVKSEIARTSSWGSKTSFESLDSGQWRAVDFPYNRPEPLKKRRTFSQPNLIFDALPDEVLEVILGMLKRQHLDSASESCATCWMRDLSNICLSSRKWAKSARIALYGDIQLVGADSAAHKKKYRLLLGPRLLMLRKTLRSNSSLAGLVRSLKVPRPDLSLKGLTTKNLDQYEDLVASLVMACPNLERLWGPMISYDHSFKKVFHALSTRAQLKEMNWLIEPLPTSASASAAKQKQKPTQSTGLGRTNSGLLAPGDLETHCEGAFLDHHRNWSALTSLSIHCLPGATVSPDSLLTRTFSMLTSLQHLHLCNLPPNAFSDTTLLSLPPLRTLSLTHVTGITSNGLSSFATCAASQSLRTLHLRHTPITSLAALSRIFSNLTVLSDFALVQAFPPLMPEADTYALWMMPYLASSTITKLHWDITSHPDCANVADDILAKSIAASGFPKLTLLRAPHDPEAIFQELCRPVAKIDLPADRFGAPETPTSPTSETALASPMWYLQKSPRTPPPQSPMEMSISSLPSCTDLRLARLDAQRRLDKASAKPKFSVFVTSEDGEPVESFKLAGYLGTVGSPIHYHLLPDKGSTDQKGGIVDVRDFSSDAGEALSAGKEGCTGAWNRREGVVADKKEKEHWWHTERGRWSRVNLP